MTIKGNIHSLESFGTVDGPGIRFVIFMQGCPLRCLYCHNPDSWDVKATGQYQLTPTELLEEVLKYKNFIKKGGVTVTGGEPLMQPEFLKQFFMLCRENEIHTALDTSGIIFNEKTKEVLEYTDLVLLDIKAVTPELHIRLTGSPRNNPLKTLDYLLETEKPVWIRHVVVPGYTDKKEELNTLAQFLQPYKSIIQKVELLPYHIMGVSKYEQMGMEYPLKDVPPVGKEEIEEARKIIREAGLPL
ncbi:MAG: pyruvate formate lyase-activating protein [Tannerellaceae bacterium]|nr:pyruvate formate lyase-activating protein [Tannerellaceae bacterium]